MNRVVQLLVSLVVGALCLWLAFRGLASGEGGLDWRELQARVAAIPWWSTAGFVGLTIVQFLARTERWRVQVRGLTSSSPAWRDALALNAVAFAAVFLLPFRLGEFVRPNLCAQRGIMGAPEALAATALERIIDGIVTTGLFAIVLLWLGDRHLPAWVRAGGWMGLLVFGGAVVFLVVAFRLRAQTTALIRATVGRVHDGIAERITRMLLGFLDGLACFRRPRDLVVYLTLSVTFWLLNGMSLWCILRGLVPDAPLVTAYFCICFLVIGVMLPAPPGNVGNFHAFARLSLTLLGVPMLPAVVCAVVVHGLSTLTVVLWALLFLVRGDVTLAGVRAAAHATTNDASPSSTRASS